ncbi:hypothetical protein LTR91_007501 [Friedmanniomyces endolithicus]|uniref:CAP-Gly domain-containing protein n=1 Tax=Friedmanniomyces endolithicus TaxID=329885 RepID=A0AAN6QVX3_9PEZI|nr:hypothetical protein LTR94_003412 [Friedmanniomyces endolithicus]KAK0810193.1 hypothetical protein LTR75_005697 [Friedmanniomyces endolithicus]KAK0812937.1 hypothetical protein LTR59_001315 [Friedmanniomyces endolithicus]KAK0820172.1 hypothetical protein LTR38_000079 [Friedmanniomyces endolithicus]KAK0842859.1 hypothetical protein LTR03_009055 [Friedmanniomyces endolithicus]
MNASSLSVGQTIELNDDRIATIRFLGPTHFQTGDWVGVELAEASGKNDGSVKGKRYFECEQDHGMFLRPSGIRQVIEQPKAGPASGVVAKGSRPSGVHAGLNGLKKQAAGSGPDRRASAISGSPTPGPRLGTGIRSPTKQLASNGTSSASTSRTNTPPGRNRPVAVPAARPRPSIAPATMTGPSRRMSTLPSANPAAAPRASRPSLAQPNRIGKTPPTRSSPGPPPPARALSTRPEQGPRMSSTTEEIADVEDEERAGELSPEHESSEPAHEVGLEDREVEEEPAKPSFAPPPIPPDPPPQTRARRPSSPTAASIHSQRTIRSTTASTRQIEELEAKVRLLERKRIEDRDVKKTLEQARQERDQYKGIIEKLQNKYRPQQQEIVELKQALSEAEKKSTDTETIQDEHDSLVELLTLDREMAQERAEGMQVELETLRAKNEEMELELEILRDENGELGKEMSPEERTSTGWLQMERSNERLREALLRLRDLTQDKEAELMEQVDDLSQQVQQVDILQSQYSEMKERLLRSEADTEDLRQQLEVALESEEMIEELTERNGRLDGHAAQLRQTIEELEDLRDINDELQINYSEQEKQLQEEIEFKDSLLNDRQLTAKQQQEALDEADYTITRYRALVSQMQSDLTDLQASKQLSETEAADLGSRSRALLDMNLRLQFSAAKTQVKTLDLELRKLDAQEASEHLAIVQLFLPDAFREERDSVLALLRFKRIAFKANLVQGFVKEQIAASRTNGNDGENAFAACEVVDKLTWIAAMAERFVSSICSCSVADFASYDGALYELEPVERALNGYIDGLRREDLNERGMADELQRSMAVMEHLGTLHIRQGDLSSYADELVMRTLYFQSQLESAASALGMMKGMVETHVRNRPGAIEAENGQDDAEDSSAADLTLVLSRAETLIQSARNAKVMAGKTTRALVDLQARALTLDREHAPDFDAIEGAAAVVARYTRQAGEALQELFGEEGRNDPFTSNEVATALNRAAISVFELQTPDAGPFSALATRLRALQDMLSDLAALPTDLDNTVEFDRAPAPWVARAEQLSVTKTTSVDTAAELDRALEALRERDAVLKGKEVELEEQSVRIEMLEARMREAGKRSARIAELERVLHEAKDDASRARADLGKAREAMEKEVERVREEMGRYGDEQRAKGGTGDVESGTMGAGARLIMRRQEGKIGDLEGAIRYLKEEINRLRLPPPDSPLSVRATMDWLHEPLVRPASEKRERDEALRKEGGEVLHRMLEMAARPQLIDLTKLPTNRLAWRPKKDVPGWQVAARREEWAALKGWGDDVVGKSTRPPAVRVGVDQSAGMRM